MQRDDIEFASTPAIVSEQDVRAGRGQVLYGEILGNTPEGEMSRERGVSRRHLRRRAV